MLGIMCAYGFKIINFWLTAFDYYGLYLGADFKIDPEKTIQQVNFSFDISYEFLTSTIMGDHPSDINSFRSQIPASPPPSLVTKCATDHCCEAASTANFCPIRM
jgi:hypothetical protein